TEERERFLDREERALDVDVELTVEVLFGDGSEDCRGGDTGVGEQDVEAALLLPDDREEPIEIGEVGDVAPDPFYVPFDRFQSCVELGLAATGDEDEGPLGGEPPGRGEADAAGAAGDQRDLSF